MAEALLQRVGNLCAGAADAAQKDSGPALEALADEPSQAEAVAAKAEAIMGVAIRSLGPEAVLAALPLNLVEVWSHI